MLLIASTPGITRLEVGCLSLCRISAKYFITLTTLVKLPLSVVYSIILPVPSTGEYSGESDQSNSGDEEYDEQFREDEADAIYQDWLVTVDREDIKMMSLMLHDNYVNRFGLTKTAASAEVGLLLGFNEKTIRLWRKDFIQNKGEFSEYQRGKYARYIILDDEEYKDMALQWVRSNSYSKETPTMTAKLFCEWVNNHLFPVVVPYHLQVSEQITTRTATRW